MFIEILSCNYPIRGSIRSECYNFESVTLNLNNVEAIKLRKSRAGISLHPDYFSAIEYHYCNKTYYELFKSDDLALNRYNVIRRILSTREYNGIFINYPDFFLLSMDASHENEPFRDYLRLFGNITVHELYKSIEAYNQQILNGNIKEEETINEWLDNYIEARKKAREAEQEKEVKKVVTLL